MYCCNYRQGAATGSKDAKKALAKAMKKKEKAEKKAQEDYQREMRKAREEQRLEEERKKEEERAKKREEEEQRARDEEEERQRQEEEEYQKWIQYITLDGEGTDAKEDLFSNQDLLNQFITTIQSKKVVSIDELAADFDMTPDVCDASIVLFYRKFYLQSIV